MAPRLMFGPRILGLEHGAKRNFTTFLLARREKAIMFNHMSLGEKKNFENVLFLIIMEHTLPFKICFSEQQNSFSLGEHSVA